MLNSNSNLSEASVIYQKSYPVVHPRWDGYVATTPSERAELFKELSGINLLDWNPIPVKRVLIAKPDGRLRPLGIPSIRDRVIQNVVKNALEPEWEAKFEASSYGFRPARRVDDAISRCLRIMNQKTKRWVFEGDLSLCYDSIDHSYLINCLNYFPAQALIKRWLKVGILFELVYYSTEDGTPQGVVISPLLCNICLHGLAFDIGIKELTLRS